MGQEAAVALHPSNRDAGCPWTEGGCKPQLTPGNVHAQIAAGAPLDVSTGFTFPTNNGGVGYSVQIILGAGGANPVRYLIEGTWGGHAMQEEIVAAGPGTYEGQQSFETITRVSSNVNPGGTTDIQTLDFFAHPKARGFYVGVTGNVIVRLVGDERDVPYENCPVGMGLPIEFTRLRCNKAGRAGITPTTATGTTGR